MQHKKHVDDGLGNTATWFQSEFPKLFHGVLGAPGSKQSIIAPLQAQKRESRGAVVTVVKLEEFEMPSICACSFFHSSRSSLDSW